MMELVYERERQAAESQSKAVGRERKQRMNDE